MRAQTRLIYIFLSVFLGTACGPSSPAPIPYFNNFNNDEEDTVEADIIEDVAVIPDVPEPLPDTVELTDVVETDALLNDVEITADVLEDTTEIDIVPEEDIAEPEEDTAEPDPPPFDPCDLDPPCLNQGVCETGVKSICNDGEWTCNYQFVPGFEGANELSCDGIDNDCDGSIDEGLTDTSISGCLTEGVCQGTVFAFCHLGEWHCDYGAVPEFELDETLCDGFDNDCDGETDELEGLSVSACKTAGICEGIAAASCVNGEILCDYSAAGDDYEWMETRCDGIDNDCDGFTDNLSISSVTPGHCDEDDPAAGPCCLLDGPCVELTQAYCEDDVWVCDYGQVPNFEDGEESLCDGIDNDCDGAVDEELDSTQSSCPLLGVCADLAPACEDGAWVCGVDGLTQYEENEFSCDGLDNDCDGEVDEDIFAAPGQGTVTCPTDGICGNDVVARCQEGAWVCDFADVVGYENPEISCDGEDNDCDGEVDEEISAPSGETVGCDKFGIGVCTVGAALSCFEGEITCTFDTVPSYELIEVSCDGLDNDCDGEIDEGMINLSNPINSTCKLDGVCEEGGVKGSCINGEWICTYNNVDNYEDNESQCDNLDNDCDGLIDENLSDPLASTCSLEGVCATGTQVACLNGDWICDYTEIPTYSGDFEYSCDGLDNNCDGFPDEDMCDLTEPCFDNAQCTANKCRFGPGSSSDGFCTTGPQCVLPDANGASATLVDPGSSACADSVSTLTCVNSQWTNQLPCPEDSPTCANGLCVKCVPGELNCSDAESRVICNAEGTDFEPAPNCASSKICVGAGVCVEADEILANSLVDPMILEEPSIAPLPSGEFIVAWDNLSGGDGDATGVYVREISNVGLAVGTETYISEATNGIQEDIYLTTVDEQAIAVWSSTDLTAFPSIVGRFRNKVGIVGDEFLVSESTTKEHAKPVAIQLPNGNIAVAWQSISPNGGTTSVAARLLDSDGVPLGGQFTVSSSTTGDQSNPQIGALPDSRFVVIWESGSNNGVDIAMQRYKADGTKQGGKIVVNDVTSGLQLKPSVAVLSNADILIAYESTAQGENEADVYLRVFNSAGFPDGSSFLAHINSGGDQSSPHVSPVGSLGYVVAYVDESGLTDLQDIVIQSFDLNHVAVGLPQAVNLSTAGDQGEPMVIGKEDGQITCIWTHVISETETDILLRFFDFSY